MPKTLYLVRHAKSQRPEMSLEDFERALNHRGRKDALEMGRRLKQKNHVPQIIVCSPAQRARQTLEGLNLGADHILFDASIYMASTRTLKKLAQGFDDRFGSAMLIGHNPGVSWLADELSDAGIGNMATCAIAAIQLHADRWNKAGCCPAELLFLDSPKKSA